MALQASIGALNDVLDASFDADRKPGKPIPAGQVTPTAGRVVVVFGAGLGLVLATPFGPGLVAIAGLGLLIGYGYDLVAKGTSWSWLPFALGTPLLPVFAWFGAVGRLPALFAVLLPAAIAAGMALAIANARADLERDRAAGLVSVAIRLGADRGWTVHAALHLGVILAALASLWISGADERAALTATGASLIIIAGVGWARGPEASAARRERAWEIEAVGVAVLAAAWLALIPR